MRGRGVRETREYVVALHLLRGVKYQEGGARQATELIEKALTFSPDYAEAQKVYQ